jgi:Glycosyl transferases group 1
MASATDLDLFVLHDQGSSRIVLPHGISVVRSQGVQYPRTSSQLRWRLEWATRRGVPLDVVMPRADRAPRRVLWEWAQPPYDVVWFATPAVYAWSGRPDFGPTVVDLMDLEDVKAQLRTALLSDQLRSGGLRSSLRTRMALYQGRLNGKDWHQFQRSVATQVDRVAVPSELDAVRSGLPNVTVIPNTYPRPRRPAGDPARGGPAVLLFQGSLDYPPNIDGAEWLTTAIAPRIRAAIPETEVRLVGRAATEVDLLHQPGVVTVVGKVESMHEELARASVAVVPVRYGGGTRVKILESFAHRVPVVSTTLGAEGLDVEHDVHLLLADDPEEFSVATVRLLRDASLRTRLARAAEDLYLERYDGRIADEAVRRLLEEIGGRRTRS